MVNSLLGLVKDQLSDKMIGRAGSLLGLPTGDARSAVTSALPAILGGIGSKVGTLDGAKSLLSLIKGQNLGTSTLETLVSSKGSETAEMGSKLASSVFGSSQDSVLDKVASLSGIGKDKSAKLMGFLTPAVMGTVGKAVKDNNLDASGLKNLFGSYTAGLGAVAGGAKTMASKATSQVTNTAKTATTAASTATTRGDSGGGGGMGWLKLLLPLLLIGALAYWFLGRGGDTTADGQMDKTEMKEGTQVQHQATGHEGHNHAPGEGHGHSATKTKDAVAGAASTVATGATNAAGAVAGAAGAAVGAAKEKMANVTGLSIDADGNLVSNGKIIAKKGAFKEVDGNYVGADGKQLGVIAKVGKAIGDAGKAVGGAAKAAGGAVAGAVAGSADAIKSKFANAFSAKEPGFTFDLSNIQWEEGGHKITSFSKEEIMGIASALKENKNGKIEVQVNGNDKGLSKKRAQVIHDQLVTLGVPNTQISSKGMGTGDATTASKVKIAVK